MPAVSKLFSSSDGKLQWRACRIISTVIPQLPAQDRAAINAHITPQLIKMLRNDEIRVKEEACKAIYKITVESLIDPKQIRYLVSQGGIKALCDLLDYKNLDVIQKALNSLENIIRVGEAEKDEFCGVNQYALLVRKAGAMEKIQNLYAEACWIRGKVAAIEDSFEASKHK